MIIYVCRGLFALRARDWLYANLMLVRAIKGFLECSFASSKHCSVVFQ